MPEPLRPSKPPRPSDPPAWYGRGLPFRCTECGDCCTGGSGYVWVTPSEAAELASTLGRPLADFARDFLRTVKGRLSLRENASGDCLLLDPASRHCRAYASRPHQCRTYPFWASIVATAETWNRESRRCPGIGEAAVVPADEIRTRIANPAKDQEA